MAGQGGGVSAGAVAVALAGALLIWSGVKGASVTQSLRSLVAGQAPAGAGANPVTGGAAGGAGGSPPPGAAGPPSASAAANQAIARLLAAPYGWSAGQQWSALVALWNRESGWSASAWNPSGAYGIAQALGHGAADGSTAAVGPRSVGATTPALINSYPSKAANAGDATAQIAWGLGYIRQTYGNPVAALAHENAAGWY